MFNRFLEFIEKKQLFEQHQKILLAISGGIDSMVLLHLFEKSGYEYGIVHCNFNLRGEESDGDENFVKQQVSIHGVPAFFQNFETEEYARLNGFSIEMAARELRYRYFEKIRSVNNYDYIATAHHLDDLIETFFLNLSRKTGIKGLTGIKEKSEKIIRPLLFTDRNEIEEFARESFINFREDSTNNEVIFQRNFLRHKILPFFSEMNPSFNKNILASIENLKDVETIYSGFIHNEKAKVIVEKKHYNIIDIEQLLNTMYPKTLLFEILTAFDFNSAVINEIFESLNNDSGKQFFSKNYRVVKDRGHLFIISNENKEEHIYYIEEDDIELFKPLNLVIGKHNANDFIIETEPNVACIDYDELEFPLLIRRWRQGDYFQPLGMTGYKKVSDFFINEKIPLHEKENSWFLCSGKKIVWIIGYRIDNRFKITGETKTVLKIELKQ
ncbi:MAG: tRNA lysidine(34) synthetase TilS [Bacteroidales bacterium]|jgi:tRNA(Ile)-lysidine synthase|nr:tRNA lysidine(34) synthetase TilS [Bacteroidales bacterium]